MPKEHGPKSFLKTSMTAIFVVDLPLQFIKEKLLLELHGALRHPGVVLGQIKPRGLWKMLGKMTLVDVDMDYVEFLMVCARGHYYFNL